MSHECTCMALHMVGVHVHLGAQPRLPCSPIEGQAFAELIPQYEGTDGEQSGPALLPVLLLCTPQKGGLLRSLSPRCRHAPPAGGSCCAYGCSEGSVGAPVRRASGKQALGNRRANLGGPEAQGEFSSCRLPARAALPQDSSCLGRAALLKLQCGYGARLLLSPVHLQQDMQAGCVSVEKMKFTGLAHITPMPFRGIHPVPKLWQPAKCYQNAAACRARVCDKTKLG